METGLCGHGIKRNGIVFLCYMYHWVMALWSDRCVSYGYSSVHSFEYNTNVNIGDNELH